MNHTRKSYTIANRKLRNSHTYTYLWTERVLLSFSFLTTNLPFVATDVLSELVGASNFLSTSSGHYVVVDVRVMFYHEDQVTYLTLLIFHTSKLE